MMSVTRWYPVYTNPKAEKRAYELLSRKGIEAYLPLQRTLKQWSDRKKWVEEPMIKSYLFVNVSPTQHAEVLMTQGIARFLYFSGKIASMPEQQIQSLKLLLATENDVEITERNFKKGENVIVTAGPLQGLKGELIDFQSSKRVLLRIDHTGQSLLIQVPKSFLEPLNTSHAELFQHPMASHPELASGPSSHPELSLC